MPRTARVSPGGMLFHGLNRGVGRMRIFRAEKDYDAFHRVVEQTLRVWPIRICAYGWMPNHGPLPQPSAWTEYVNLPQTEAELEAIGRCVRRGSPYGNTIWTEQTAEQLALQSTLRGRGRPNKERP